MRLRRLACFVLFITMRLGESAAAAQVTDADRPPDQQDGSVVEIDLASAKAEVIIAPSSVYALPEKEFPEAVVVDLSHRKAYAATEFVAINVFSLLSAVWIEALALLSVVVSIWWIRRLARRPQQTGQPYCRRCNYLLSHLRGEVCPECGSVITGRGQMVGRRRWPRLSMAIAGLLTTVGLYTSFCLRAPRLIWPDSWPAWWSQSLDAVARANSKYQWLIQHSRVVAHLVEIDLDAGGATRTLWIGTRSETDHINNLFLSDDARRLTVWHTDGLRVWSLPAGVMQTRIDDSNLSLPFSLRSLNQVELSGDERTAVLLGPAPRYQAIAIDVDSRRRLWAIDDLVTGDVSGVRLMHGPGLDRFVVAADESTTGVTDLTEWYIDDDQHPNRMRHTATSVYLVSPSLAIDALGSRIWASDIDGVEAWNLQTERVDRRFALPRRPALLSAWPGAAMRLIITMFDQDSLTWIVDTENGRVLAQLDGPPLRTRRTRVLSDGRTLAVWGYDADFSHKVVQLYDLSSIAPAEQPRQ